MCLAPYEAEDEASAWASPVAGGDAWALLPPNAGEMEGLNPTSSGRRSLGLTPLANWREDRLGSLQVLQRRRGLCLILKR